MQRLAAAVVILFAVTTGTFADASAQVASGSFAAVPVFGATGLASAVFMGGSVDQLETVTLAIGANGAWVQAADGAFSILVAGGPSFLKDAFKGKSPKGFSGPTAVTLVRTSTATATPTPAAGSPIRNAADCPESSLRTATTERGFALGMGGINQNSLYMIRDSTARDTLRCAANIVTANGFYWSTVESKQGQFNFAQGDEMLNYAMVNGLAVRGHVLVWHNSLPTWLESGTFTSEQLKTILKTHIQTVVGRYRGKIAAWDVLNEAIDDKGNLRDTIWLRALGPEYIELAFRWAHEADPDALLFYNEYRNEGAGQVPDRQYELVRDLKQKGVPIHGVGMQMHLIQGRETTYGNVVSRTAALNAMSENIARLGALGVTIHITEMDVSVLKLSGNKLAVQADIYANILQTCLATPVCTALLTWNLDDGHTWLSGRYAGSENDAPLLFDRELRPKPALDELRKVLAAR